MSRRRCSAVAIAIVALAVTAPTTSAAPQKIVPAGPDPAWGCVQGAVPSLTVRATDGDLAAPTFRQANARLTRQIQALSRRLKRTGTAKARRRLRGQRQRLAATRTAVARCRAGKLPAPAPSRRSFAFVCLHGFVLPSVMVGGSCAVDLRPRGVPDTRARAAYTLSATYGTLDTVLYAECSDDDGAFEGAERMEDIFGLYLVRCGAQASDDSLPAGEAWPILRMDVDNCDEILAADENGCGPSDPKPKSDPSPSPRTPPSQPQGDCIILGMETENPDC